MNEMDKIKVLADIVEIPSVNDDEVSVAKYIMDLFAKYGIESKILKVKGNRANLVAEIGEKGPILGFSGHLDVVAAKESDGWHSDPFKLVERDGKLYGRGTSDMKSGVAAMIVSLIELQQKGLKNGRIRLMLTMGEEIGEEGSAYFYEHGYMKDVSALVISEPTYYRIIYAEKGSLDLKITSRGKAAHSSMPNLGYNAVNPLIELLSELNEFFSNPPKNDVLGPLTFNVTVFKGGEQVNTIPDYAEAEINVRTLPNFDGNDVIKKLDEYLEKKNENGATLTREVLMNEDAVLKSPDSVIADLAAEIVESRGREVVKTIAPGITDASNLLKEKKEDYPFIVFGPGNPLVSHQVDEYVEKKAYLDFIDIYQELAEKYFIND